MSAPRVSIIIPFYNAAEHIERSVISALAQTLPQIEVLAVDDGSTDNSVALLDVIAEKDKRLRVFRNSKKGVSAARNIGLNKAEGEYISFVDADDWIQPGMLESLYYACNDQNCDWSICNVSIVENNEIKGERLHLEEDVISIPENRAYFLSRLLAFNYDYATWNKLYKNSIIKENGIRFKEEMFLWEDLLFNLQYQHYVGCVSLVSKPLYFYRAHDGSLYHRSMEDRLPQFNLLYRNYMTLPTLEASLEEKRVFRTEMARMTYHGQLHELEIRVGSEDQSFSTAWKTFTRLLKDLDADLFYFPDSTVLGVQGIKKWLLMRRRFKIVALLMTCKSHLKGRSRKVSTTC
jgi:glycosyltransferase involved in cell wall biosynthesis